MKKSQLRFEENEVIARKRNTSEEFWYLLGAEKLSEGCSINRCRLLFKF
jgi:hypothetical protein